MRGFFIVVVVVVAYFPALQGGFIWDDNTYLTENPTVQSRAGLASIWLEPKSNPQYYPLVFTSFWVEHRLWGLRPLGYHAVNILLHAASALVLWRVLSFLAIPGAFLAALLFGVHPVNVESVAWISERKNVLSGLFYLLALLAALRYFLTSEGNKGGAPAGKSPSAGAVNYGLSLFFFVLALFSKTVTATLPAATLLLLWWKRGKLRLREFGLLVPFLVLGLALGLTTAWLESSHVGAAGSLWAFSIAQRLLIAGRALWFYPGKLLWPQQLLFNYPRWEIENAQWSEYLFPLSIATLFVVLWTLRGKIGRGPFTLAALYAGTLFPALGFFNVFPMYYSFVADHFQYLASIVPLTGIAALASRRTERIARRLQVTIFALPIALLVFLTWKQCGMYSDKEALWRTTLEGNPRSWLACNNLGAEYLLKKRPDQALLLFEKSIEINPLNAEAVFNIGIILYERGELDAAQQRFEDAIRIDRNYANAYRNLGGVWYAKGDIPKAVYYFEKSLRILPGDAQTHDILGAIFSRQGNHRDAVHHFREVLRIKPDYPGARKNLELELAALRQHSLQ